MHLLKQAISVTVCASALMASCTSIVAQKTNTADLQTSMPSEAILAHYDVQMGKQIVQLHINGQGPFAFIFDTGAGGMMISNHTKNELGLVVTGKDMVGSPADGTPFEVEIVNIPSLTLAGLKAENTSSTVIDFGPKNIAGVIGPTVFRDYGRLAIDFTTQNIEIGGPLRADKNTHWIPFGESAPLLDVNLKIGTADIAAHIDTGAPQTIAIPGKYADQLPLTGPITVIGTARTIDREFEIRAAPLKTEVTIGDATIPLESVQFFDLPFANIGLGALHGLYLEIDWGNERFALSGQAKPKSFGRRRVARKPGGSAGGGQKSDQDRRRVVRRISGPKGSEHANPELANPQGGQRMVVQKTQSGNLEQMPPFGVMLVPNSQEGTLLVEDIIPDSRAEALGVMAQDIIVSINGKTPADIGFENIRMALGRPVSAFTVLRDGVTIELVK